MPKTGRPPSRPPGLVTFTARLTPDEKERLMAVAQVKGEYAYHILAEAFEAYWRQLPADERRAAQAIATAVRRARR